MSSGRVPALRLPQVQEWVADLIRPLVRQGLHAKAPFLTTLLHASYFGTRPHSYPLGARVPPGRTGVDQFLFASKGTRDTSAAGRGMPTPSRTCSSHPRSQPSPISGATTGLGR